MIQTILLSILKTLTVSAILSGLFIYYTSYTFVDVFVTTIILQFVLFYIWNTYTQYKLRLVQEVEETKRTEMYTQQGVTVECAHCKSMNYIPIRMDQENGFDCEDCGRSNSVYIDVTVARKTEIVDKITNKADAERKLREG